MALLFIGPSSLHRYIYALAHTTADDVLIANSVDEPENFLRLYSNKSLDGLVLVSYHLLPVFSSKQDKGEYHTKYHELLRLSHHSYALKVAAVLDEGYDLPGANYRIDLVVYSMLDGLRIELPKQAEPLKDFFNKKKNMGPL
jgi:hypothetical protein